MPKLEKKVKAKVSRDFALKKINTYISLAKSSTKDIYEKDYRVIHNNDVFEGGHTKISIENDLIEIDSIEITKNTVSFSKNFLDIEVGFFSDLAREEKVYFQIDLGTEIKILVSLEQYNEINNKHLKETEFLNIMYPFFANNMQQDTFLFKSSRLVPAKNRIENKITLAFVSHSGQYCIDSSVSSPLFGKESAIKRYIKEGEEDIYSKIRQEYLVNGTSDFKFNEDSIHIFIEDNKIKHTIDTNGLHYITRIEYEFKNAIELKHILKLDIARKDIVNYLEKELHSSYVDADGIGGWKLERDGYDNLVVEEYDNSGNFNLSIFEEDEDGYNCSVKSIFNASNSNEYWRLYNIINNLIGESNG